METSSFSLVSSIDSDGTWDFLREDTNIGKVEIHFLSHDKFIENEEEVMLELGLDFIIDASEEHDGIYYLNWMSINEDYRGNNYGNILLDKTISLLKELDDGYPIFLNACSFDKKISNKDLANVYKKRGFRNVSSIEHPHFCYMFSTSISSLHTKENIKSSLKEEKEEKLESKQSRLFC